MTTCERTIIDKDWTGHNKRKCGKNATHTQNDGLPLCERHYNKWIAKQDTNKKASMKIKLSKSQWEIIGKTAGWMKTSQTQQEPSDRQLDLCYKILERIGKCEADEYGQPLFEKSPEAADRFIKQHQHLFNSSYDELKGNTDISAGEWGGIPNS